MVRSMTGEVPVKIEPSGRFTTVRVPDQWYVACLASELRSKPVGRTVLGIPLVLFRDARGAARALVDRCPHRNVPLSIGRCVGGELECGYHGWRFDGDGICVDVPGLAEPSDDRAVRRAGSFPTLEQDGMIWVVPSGVEPEHGPVRFDGVGRDGYRTIELRLDVPGPMVAAVENALDVPHTSFLHRGLFRGRRERVPIAVTVRHRPDAVEAVFEGEPVPPGLLAKLLSAEHGVVEHTDRFVVPALAQVEYRLDQHHIILNAFYTPVDDDRCVLHAAAAFRLPIPTAVARSLVVPLARIVLQQDNRVLRRQRENIDRFGGERFVNTPIDLLGPHILRLLRRAERGDAPPTEVAPDEHLTMLT